MFQQDCQESEKLTPVKLSEAFELLVTKESQDADIEEIKKSNQATLEKQLFFQSSMDSNATCPNTFPTMTSEEMESSLSATRKNVHK